jgi:uncharacterized membrane protein YphA (DoxX/SURF4 family)
VSPYEPLNPGRPRTGLEILYHLVRIGCGLVFLYASWGKIVDPAGFARIIQNYQMLPALLVHPVAIVLPWVEAVCGISLVSGVRAGGGLVVFTGLMTTFTGALALNAVRGIDTECGCFSMAAGPGSGRVLEDVLRDVVILAAALWALRHRVRRSAA